MPLNDLLARRAEIIGAADSDKDPDEAARIIDLSRATGVPSPIVESDPKGWELKFRRELVQGIISGSTHLQDYINSHPAAARISNDDWAALQRISDQTKKFGQPQPGAWTHLSAEFMESIKEPDRTVLQAGIEGLKAGWGEHEWGSWQKDVDLRGLAAEYPKTAKA